MGHLLELEAGILGRVQGGFTDTGSRERKMHLVFCNNTRDGGGGLGQGNREHKVLF